MRRLVLVFALCGAIGCGSTFWSRPVATPEQAATVAAIQAAALAGCIELGQALNHGERETLSDSLVVVGATLRGTDPGGLTSALAAIDPAAAPYASAVAGLVYLASDKMPPGERLTTRYAVAVGVVSECMRGLGLVEG